MIRYLFHGPHAYTLNSFLAGFKWEIAAHFETIDYRRFLRRSRLPVSSYIFSDLERLSNDELEQAARAWQALEGAGGNIRLLNHPLRIMRRYELLRVLYEAGINRFNVYRLTECRRPERFPVFIRVANDHRKAETPLLYTQKELDDAIEGLLSAGKGRAGRIITEYCHPEIDGRGYYRKYGAYIIAGEIIPSGIIFGDSWVVQMPNMPYDAYMLKERERYLRDDAHIDQLQRVASLAHIDYGRIDFALVKDRVQVFEINTNPSVPAIDPADPPEFNRQKREVGEKIMSALLAVDSPEPAGTAVALQPDVTPWYWRYRNLPYEAAYTATRLPFLRRYAPLLFWHLKRRIKKTYQKHQKSLLQKKLINP
jgi:hypothetical protein